MQFGRIYGIGLIVLGILLCTLQVIRYMSPAKELAPQTEPRTAKTEHVTSSLPGIIGAGSLVAGIALFMTARRKDEPDPKHAVR
jgi:hypothetical protein